MSFMSKFTNARSSMPQMTRQGGVGPAKMKMPQNAGESMPRAKKVGGMFSSKIGNPLTQLPQHPQRPFKGGAPSLFHTSSSGLGGIKPMV